MNTKLFAAILCVTTIATSNGAVAQESPAAGEAKPPVVNDQMKQLGGQLLMSLFERLVQGKPKAATAMVEDATASADAPALIDEPAAESEPTAAQPKDKAAPARYFKRSKRPS